MTRVTLVGLAAGRELRPSNMINANSQENCMTRALTKCALAASIVGAFAVAGTAGIAQVAVEVGPPGYGYGVYGGPYGAYGPGAEYGYYPPTNGIYGGPTSNLFDYEGPNHGAMVRQTR
jgi:hypothetical protein